MMDARSEVTHSSDEQRRVGMHSHPIAQRGIKDSSITQSFGVGGQSASIKDIRKYAIVYFDVFLKSVSNIADPFTFGKDYANLTEPELVRKEVFQKFSFWLIYKATIIDDPLESKLATGTALNYFSGIKNLASKKFANAELWKLDETTWYTPILGEMLRFGNLESMERGETIGEKSPPLGRILLNKGNCICTSDSYLD